VAKGISKDDFLKANKVKKEANYSFDAYFTYQKTQQQKKDEPETLPEEYLNQKVHPSFLYRIYMTLLIRKIPTRKLWSKMKSFCQRS
jgi:hypothetical protein